MTIWDEIYMRWQALQQKPNPEATYDADFALIDSEIAGVLFDYISVRKIDHDKAVWLRKRIKALDEKLTTLSGADHEYFSELSSIGKLALKDTGYLRNE